MSLEQRMNEVEVRIERACERSGRERNEIHLIAVTKYVSVEMMEKVLASGCEHIGENRWQDASAKWDALGHLGTWHFIGSLQTNKVRDVVGKFAYIHSLDRLSLAKELNKRAAQNDSTVQAFIQVNVSGEGTKQGVAPHELHAFAREISALSHLHIVGLMMMAPHEDNPEAVRPVFRELRLLRDELNDAGIFSYHVADLSMGMSNDFEVAIEEGATWIRLGSVLVGKE